MIDRSRRRDAGRRRGFTLIELIAVMVIVLILAATAAPAVTGAGATRAGVAARQLHHDLGLARQWAVASGTRTWVVLEPAGDAWSILVEDPDAPGRAGATPLLDPGSGRPCRTTLGAGFLAGVDLVSADFDGAAEVGFDWLGRPLDAAESDLAAPGTAVLSGGHTITVEVETGYVTHAGP